MHIPSLPAGRRLGGRAIALVVTVTIGAAVAAAASTASAHRANATAAATPRCSTSRLVIWLDTHGNGAAGSITYTLKFTNLSGHNCTLFGYPGVSAVSISGRQLGRAAARDTARTPRTVTLRNGATATTLVRIVDVHNFPPSSCRPTTAAGLRVFPPNQAAAKVVPFPFGACSRRGPTYLFVRAVR